jgi:hypothetical protein
LDNIFLAEESITWATESKQNLVVILIDSEKAFNWVNWTFLQGTMRTMEFSKGFMHWTSILYKTSSSQVVVNGAISQEFLLG